MQDKLLNCPFCGETVEIGVPYAKWNDGKGITYGCMIRHDCPGMFAGVYHSRGEDKTPEAAISTLTEAWNRRAEPPNNPLTLEELKGMVGEPVWTQAPGVGWWRILYEADLKYIVGYGLVGSVYRRKPEGERNEI